MVSVIINVFTELCRQAYRINSLGTKSVHAVFLYKCSQHFLEVRRYEIQPHKVIVAGLEMSEGMRTSPSLNVYQSKKRKTNQPQKQSLQEIPGIAAFSQFS